MLSGIEIFNFFVSDHLKGELDCFNCKTGGFLRLFTSMFTTKKSNYNPRFCKKIKPSMEIFNNSNEKLSAPRIHTVALIESLATAP